MKIPCNLIGHRWIPVFIAGEKQQTPIKIIGCYCKRCNKGYTELVALSESMYETSYSTYNEKYWGNDTQNNR